ncbi:hypothetical protein ART_2538 [Arthrobacter sp. PAMC 25486]|nr:hypothetical protein ART_2538 [Arthrobacter sp. PAMC 25486]
MGPADCWKTGHASSVSPRQNPGDFCSSQPLNTGQPHVHTLPAAPGTQGADGRGRRGPPSYMGNGYPKRPET